MESALPEQVHRVLLYGAPGTGKSSWAGTAFAHVERIALHPQQPQEDLIGSLLLTSGAPVELRERIAKAKLDQQQRLLLEVHLGKRWREHSLAGRASSPRYAARLCASAGRN